MRKKDSSGLWYCHSPQSGHGAQDKPPGRLSDSREIPSLSIGLHISVFALLSSTFYVFESHLRTCADLCKWAAVTMAPTASNQSCTSLSPRLLSSRRLRWLLLFFLVPSFISSLKRVLRTRSLVSAPNVRVGRGDLVDEHPGRMACSLTLPSDNGN